MMMTAETKDWEHGQADIRKVKNGFLASYEVSRRYQTVGTGETFFATLSEATEFVANQIALSDELAQEIRDDSEASPPF
jgi:hypothetical protein